MTVPLKGITDLKVDPNSEINTQFVSQLGGQSSFPWGQVSIHGDDFAGRR